MVVSINKSSVVIFNMYLIQDDAVGYGFSKPGLMVANINNSSLMIHGICIDRIGIMARY